MPIKHREQPIPKDVSRATEGVYNGQAVKVTPPSTIKRAEQPGPERVSKKGPNRVQPKPAGFPWNNELIEDFELLRAQIRGMRKLRSNSKVQSWIESIDKAIEKLKAGNAVLKLESEKAHRHQVVVDSVAFQNKIEKQIGRFRRLKVDYVDEVRDSERLAARHDKHIREKLYDISLEARKARQQYVEQLQDAMK